MKSNNALIVILGTVTTDAVGIGLVMPVLPGLLRDIVHSDSIASHYGVLLALYALMQFLCAPVLGALSDRFGRRPVLLASLLGATIDYAIMATTPVLWICLAGLPQFFNLPAQLFVLNFSIPFGIPFYDGGRVIKHLITLATASQNGHSLFLPVLNGTDTRTENVSQLLLLTSIVHSTDKTEKGNDRGQKLAFSTCRFLSFQRVF